MTSLVKQHGRQCMSCSVNFSVSLQTEILSTVTSDFLKQMIILKEFNSLLLIELVFRIYHIVHMQRLIITNRLL